MQLVDITELEVALKTEKSSNVKLLHKFIFENDAGRNNRKNIRQFTGFSFITGSSEYEQKVNEIKTSYSINELITICNVLCINNEGNLDDLATRIVSCLCDLSLLKASIIHDEIETDSDSEDEQSNHETQSNGKSDCDDPDFDFENNSKINENITCKNSGLSSNPRKNSGIVKDMQLPVQEMFPKPTVNFSDVEKMIVPFHGDSFQNVEKWIENFEDVVNLLNLSDIHKLIIARKFMAGKAKLFIQSETKINSWHKMKTLLISEFGLICNSADVHEMLSKRKMKENESLDEYFLIMKQLCSRGNVEDSALMQYVVNGINDSTVKKSCLYGCQYISEFETKLKVYEKIRNDYDKAKPSKPKVEVKNKSKTFKTETRCFNCGQNNHKSIDCLFKDKGPKCFRCSKFGHKSFECSKTKPNDRRNDQSQVNVINSRGLILKNAKLCSLNVTSLLDTGSQKTLIKKNVYDKISDFPKLQPSVVTLSGLGQSSIRPLGCFRSEIEIDGSKFDAEIFVIKDELVNFDLILGMDVINQGTLTISTNGVRLDKTESPSDNFLINIVNVLDDHEIDLNHISDSNLKHELYNMIRNYSPNKTKTVDVKMKIILNDEIPVFSSPRRLPQVEQKIVEAQVEEWLEKGIIKKSSDFSSQIVLVKKKDKSLRLCVDYRRLNKKTVREHFPLPMIDDVIDKLHSAEVFTTLDLKNVFFHVDVKENSRKYTAFVTHEGQYEFLKCPFGLTNSPSVFQRYIYNVFRQLLKYNTVVIYMDDLIIPSENEVQGIEKLKLVLQTAAEYGLELNIKKCNFLKREIDFLGYRIANGKLHPSPLKTKAVINFPEPKCVKDVQSYLGLTGYFRKFIEHYSVIAKPLSDLLKKYAKFEFDNNARYAFNKLKNILTTEPVLSIYDPKCETEVHCDACLDGYGAALMQKSMADNQLHPVYFYSKKTTAAERKYCSYELEVLAVINALKKFRIYVLGIPFKIVTDCKAFELTMEKKDICTRIARWAIMLSEFDYEIEHRKGSRMKHVDALSRNAIVMITQDSLTHKIIQAQETDEHVKAIKEILKSKPFDGYLTKNGVLYKCVNGNDVLVVPEEMQIGIIRAAHEKGHFAVKRTEENLSNQFYIPQIRQKIEKCISNCVPCILINRKRGKQDGLFCILYKRKKHLYTLTMLII